jgi:type VI protein secretion system component VasK
VLMSSTLHCKDEVTVSCAADTLKLFFGSFFSLGEGDAMTPDLMRALAISGSVLIAVVILIIIVSMVTVRRGEVAMSEDAKPHRHSGHH